MTSRVRGAMCGHPHTGSAKAVVCASTGQYTAAGRASHLCGVALLALASGYETKMGYNLKKKMLLPPLLARMLII